jgi:hypothetical protein
LSVITSSAWFLVDLSIIWFQGASRCVA